MRIGAVLLVAACCAAFAPPVSADVRVTFANGRVTVIASDATVREILAEWSRVGGSTFVDADKIPSTERLTIHLEDQNELDAIDVLLRQVAGYMVSPAASAANASMVGRVFILPTSTPAPYVAPPPVAEVAAPQEAPRARVTSAPVQPDDDGPVRVSAPPPPSASAPQAPLGQASPLIGGTQTQTNPGLGVVTSSQPGVVIASPGATRPMRPTTRPSQPVTRPGGGGGGGRR